MAEIDLSVGLALFWQKLDHTHAYSGPELATLILFELPNFRPRLQSLAITQFSSRPDDPFIVRKDLTVWLNEVRTLFNIDAVKALDFKHLLIGLWWIDDRTQGDIPQSWISEIQDSIEPDSAKFAEMLTDEGKRYFTISPDPSSIPYESVKNASADMDVGVGLRTEIIDRKRLLSDQVPLHLDNPAEIDQLNREAFADVLSMRVRRLLKDSAELKERSYMIHLEGPWGSGKTTLLNFLKKRLSDPIRAPWERWAVIEFNAWQHQRHDHPWWYLMEHVFNDSTKQIKKDGEPQRARWIRRWHTRWRLFVCFWSNYLAAILIGLVSIILFLIGKLLPASETGPAGNTPFVAFLKDLSLFLGNLGTIFGFILAVIQSLTLRSSDVVKQFFEKVDDPVEKVRRHFNKMVDRIQNPVIVFIDDLDRCDASYIVKLLESIQTLFRKRIFFIVAADGRWLRAAYESVYTDFKQPVEESGKPIGVLFLDKIFQLSVALPSLSKELQQDYWQLLLRFNSVNQELIDKIREYVTDEANRNLKEKNKEADIIDTLGDTLIMPSVLMIDNPLSEKQLNLLIKQGIIGAVVRRLADADIELARINRLQPYFPFLEANPRSMKRFVNAYAMAQAEDIITERQSDLSVLALWTILRLRWPLLAEHLSDNPDHLQNILDKKPDTLTLPKDIKKLFHSKDVQNVINGKAEGVNARLTVESLKKILGLNQN
ncbi:hypothetical protein HY229_01175 [Candidatus Acetothermia bacterium]|nr:hypothetical protein [Candidatus Acetothermia bacterium]MBI3642700.1 hypothetical protein [Candidatus Acetothermia bacterium]